MDEDTIKALDKLAAFKEKEGKIMLFKGGTKISGGKSKTDAIDNLKKKYKSLTRSVKIYIVTIDVNKKYNPKFKTPYGPLSVTCSQVTLDTEYKTKTNIDDGGQTIYWSIKELKELGFKKGYIKSIIKAVKNKKIETKMFRKYMISDVMKVIK